LKTTNLVFVLSAFIGVHQRLNCPFSKLLRQRGIQRENLLHAEIAKNQNRVAGREAEPFPEISGQPFRQPENFFDFAIADAHTPDGCREIQRVTNTLDRLGKSILSRARASCVPQ
jgi:hypothetical protein